MSIHDGHRQRLRERFLREGLDGFTEIQALELLLFYAIPRKDTNPLAHELLRRFGTMARVMDAPIRKLTEVDGITENVAALLKLVREVERRYLISQGEEIIINTIPDCCEYLSRFFRGRKNETVYLMSLDAKLKVLSCREVGEGSINYASVPIRRCVEMALEDGATSVILAHNHPSGIAVPSNDDISTTRRLAMALSAVEIQLVDHIVVADEEYVSMVQSGYRFDDCVIY